MMSAIPVDIRAATKENLDKEILRVGIIAEMDAINLYEQMAALTKNEDIRKVLMDVTKEEKRHVGEFRALLLGLDTEMKIELEEGRKEVEKLTGKKL